MKKTLGSITSLVIVGLLGLFPCQGKPRDSNPQSGASSNVELTDRMLHRRAVEAVIWGTPAVNFDRMYQAMVHDTKAGEGSNKIVYWSRRFDWKNQTLTPNPDTIYFQPFFNTKMCFRSLVRSTPATHGFSWSLAKFWFAKADFLTTLCRAGR